MIGEIERNHYLGSATSDTFSLTQHLAALSSPVTATTLLARLRGSSLVSALVLAFAARIGAQGVVPATAYVRENWTVADGLPINTINAIIQTRDGYLWLGTNDGVVRFDGVRFTVYNAGNTPELPSNRIVSLHEDRAGALWILTEQQHLVRHVRGLFTHIDASRGLRSGALQLTESPDGTLIVATTRGAGVVRNARFTPLADSIPITDGYGGSAVQRADGSVWIAAQRNGLWRAAGGRVENVTPPELRTAALNQVAVDGRGRLWIASTQGVWIEDHGFRMVGAPNDSINSTVALRVDNRVDRAWLLGQNLVAVATDTAARVVTRFPPGFGLLVPNITLDSTGAAWYANGPELFRDGRRVMALEGRLGDNLAPGAITSVAIDREGSIWIGTRASGLYRLKSSVFSVISVREGLLNGNVYPVYEDPWGSVWIGTLGYGASRVDAGSMRVTNCPSRDASGE